MMEARGRVLMAGCVALVALLVFCVPGCGNKAAEARYERLNALRINLYDVALLIHSFQAESGRVFTDFSVSGYGGLFAGGVRGQQLGSFPVNPCTHKQMTPADFKVFRYANEQDAYDQSVGGPNDLMTGQPGNIVFGYYAPPGTADPTRWTLLGIDADGRSYRAKDSTGKALIVVYHD
jgi:hypothetical protein